MDRKHQEKKLPKPFYSGKIRDLYAVDELRLILAATDRISAFDVVFPETVASKGIILNRISSQWYRAIRRAGLPDRYGFDLHLISDDISQFPPPFCDMPELAGRSTLVERAQRIDFECIVRGYLAGSAWKEYQQCGSVCGQRLPQGLRAAERLPSPLFTPTTKAGAGAHDENVLLADMERILGSQLTQNLKKISIELYRFAEQQLAPAGILLADSKFEFGFSLNGKRRGRLLLIDELLTPDSSRFWPAADWSPGRIPPGFDKQHIRDFAEQSGWNKKAPPPPLPAAILKRTEERYREIAGLIEQALARQAGPQQPQP